LKEPTKNNNEAAASLNFTEEKGGTVITDDFSAEPAKPAEQEDDSGKEPGNTTSEPAESECVEGVCLSYDHLLAPEYDEKGKLIKWLVIAENGTEIGRIPQSVNVTGEFEAECTPNVAAAFKILHDRAPEYYEWILNYLKGLECVDTGSGADVYNGIYMIGTTQWNNTIEDPAQRLARTAAFIVHDTCHIWQYQRDGWNFYDDPEASEVECMKIELKAYRQMGYDSWWLDKMVTDPEYRKIPGNAYWDCGKNGNPECNSW
jgi:hypothetical protein